MIESNRERVYQAILDYVIATHRAIGRGNLARVVNMKLPALDEHIRTLRETGRIHSDTPGYYEPAAQFPADDAMSVTVLPTGMRKVEKGEAIMEFTPHEWATLGQMAYGSTRDLSERQHDNQQNGTVAQLKAMVKEQGKQLADMAIRMAKWQKANQKDLFEGPRTSKET